MYFVGRPELLDYMRKYHSPHIPKEVYETRGISAEEIEAALGNIEAKKKSQHRTD